MERFQVMEGDKRSVVFVEFIEHCTSISAVVDGEGLLAVPMSGQMAKEQKADALSKWKDTPSSVLVATTAAGQGVDHPRVGLVVVLFEPKEPNVLVQVVGSGGRSGVECECALAIRPCLDSWCLPRSCIRKCLYCFADGEGLAFSCSETEGALACQVCKEVVSLESSQVRVVADESVLFGSDGDFAQWDFEGEILSATERVASGGVSPGGGEEVASLKAVIEEQSRKIAAGAEEVASLKAVVEELRTLLGERIVEIDRQASRIEAQSAKIAKQQERFDSMTREVSAGAKRMEVIHI